MNGLAKEQIAAGIAEWLPQGHIITTGAQQNDNTIVIGWMNGYGTTSIADVTFEQNVIDELQKAIEAHDENLVESYLDEIEAEILRLADVHGNGDQQSWNLTRDVLSHALAQMRAGRTL